MGERESEAVLMLCTFILVPGQKRYAAERGLDLYHVLLIHNRFETNMTDCHTSKKLTMYPFCVVLCKNNS